MDYYITTTEASEKWGISSRRVALLCEQHRIDGVVKKGKTWLIPYTAIKPIDARTRKYKEQKEDTQK